MKTILLFLLTLPALAQQYLPTRVKIVGYRGNVVESVPLTLLPSDTAKTLSIESTINSFVGSQSTRIQPVLIRTGLNVVVRYDSSLSLPQTGYYRLKVNGETRYEGEVNVGLNVVTVTPTDGLKLNNLLSQLETIASGKLPTTTFTSFVTSQDSRDDAQEAVASSLSSTKLNKADTTSMLASYAHSAAVYPKTQTYSQTEANNLLLAKLDVVTVANYSAAVAIATGSTAKYIRVLSDSNRGGYANTYVYWPDSTDTDKLELVSL